MDGYSGHDTSEHIQTVLHSSEFSRRVETLHLLLLQHKRSTPVITLAAVGFAVIFFLLFLNVPEWFAADTGDGSANYFSMALFALVPAYVLWHYGKRWFRKKILISVGSQVFSPLANLAAPGLTFQVSENMTKQILDHSLLFDSAGEGRTTVEGTGSARGTATGMNYWMSALRIEKKFQHGCRRRGGTLFGGILICFDVEQESYLNEFVVAAPRAAAVTEEVVGVRFAEEEKNRKRNASPPDIKEIVFYSDKEFDRWFYTVGTNKEAGEAILTPERRNRMVTMLEKEKYQPSLSQRDKTLYVAFEGDRVFWHLPDKAQATREQAEALCRRYCEEFSFLKTLADDFIASKQAALPE